MTRLPLSLALALAGVLAAELWQVSDDPPPPAPPPQSPASPVSAPVPAAERPSDPVPALLARPLFTPGRRPPRDVPAAVAQAPQAGQPRLAGVLVGGSGRRAILVPAPGGKPAVVTEGARVGEFVVERIEPGQVTLSGPGGTRVLRPAFDPSPPAARTAVSPIPGLTGLIGPPGPPANEMAR